ncbi:MAG: MFS transporter, partial [Myxococcota bacterium]|nr:MFS transporter [Myxococcota bacterium]
MSRPRLASMALLGFSSGLPFLLSSSTLQAWMTLEGVDLTTLGLFSLVGIPYAAKPLWAPLMDTLTPPWLGRRRGWMLITQVYLMVIIAAASQLSPAAMPMLAAVVALLMAFGGSSQDIVLDAYRTDILTPRERGPGISLWAL